MKKIYLIISIIILGVLVFSGVFEKIDPVRAISTEGLVGWWKMDDNLATTAVVDETGTNNGSFNDPTGDPNTNAHSAVSLHDRALTFDSTDDYVDCGSEILFDSTKPLTISLWTNVDDYVGMTFPTPILLKTDQATGFVIMYHTAVADWLGITFGSSANFVMLKTVTDISADLLSWKHIVVTYDGVDRTSIASYKLFVDAVEQSLNAGSLTSVTNVNYIGRGHSDNYTWFDGQIDQVRIYNRALSAEEIALHYFLESETRIKNATIKNAEIK